MLKTCREAALSSLKICAPGQSLAVPHREQSWVPGAAQEQFGVDLMDTFQSLLLHPTGFTLLVSSLKITLQLSGAHTWPSTNPSWGLDNQGLILLSCLLLFKGLLSEINDPDSFLKDLLNSIP